VNNSSGNVKRNWSAKKILAIVPARGGSKGLPGKNKRLLCGKPLVSYPIIAAKNSQYISRIICSTDDLDIAGIARFYGAEVPRLRPESLAKDETSTIDVVIDILEKDDKDSEVIVVLEPTSPLTTATDIDRGLELLLSSESYPSLISVSELISGHPQFVFNLLPSGRVESVLGDKWEFRRRQELSPLYFQDGSLYMSTRSNLLRKKSFVSFGSVGLIMPKFKSFEIDDEVDWLILEALLTRLEDLQHE